MYNSSQQKDKIIRYDLKELHTVHDTVHVIKFQYQDTKDF